MRSRSSSAPRAAALPTSGENAGVDDSPVAVKSTSTRPRAATTDALSNNPAFRFWQNRASCGGDGVVVGGGVGSGGRDWKRTSGGVASSVVSSARSSVVSMGSVPEEEDSSRALASMRRGGKWDAETSAAALAALEANGLDPVYDEMVPTDRSAASAAPTRPQRPGAVVSSSPSSSSLGSQAPGNLPPAPIVRRGGGGVGSSGAPSVVTPPAPRARKSVPSVAPVLAARHRMERQASSATAASSSSPATAATSRAGGAAPRATDGTKLSPSTGRRGHRHRKNWQSSADELRSWLQQVEGVTGSIGHAENSGEELLSLSKLAANARARLPSSDDATNPNYITASLFAHPLELVATSERRRRQQQQLQPLRRGSAATIPLAALAPPPDAETFHVVVLVPGAGTVNVLCDEQTTTLDVVAQVAENVELPYRVRGVDAALDDADAVAPVLKVYGAAEQLDAHVTCVEWRGKPEAHTAFPLVAYKHIHDCRRFDQSIVLVLPDPRYPSPEYVRTSHDDKIEANENNRTAALNLLLADHAAASTTDGAGLGGGGAGQGAAGGDGNKSAILLDAFFAATEKLVGLALQAENGAASARPLSSSPASASSTSKASQMSLAKQVLQCAKLCVHALGQVETGEMQRAANKLEAFVAAAAAGEAVELAKLVHTVKLLGDAVRATVRMYARACQTYFGPSALSASAPSAATPTSTPARSVTTTVDVAEAMGTFKVNVASLHRLPAALRQRCPNGVSVSAALWLGGRQLCEPAFSTRRGVHRPGGMHHKVSWDDWLDTGVPIRNLPADVRLCLTVHADLVDVNPSAMALEANAAAPAAAGAAAKGSGEAGVGAVPSSAAAAASGGTGSGIGTVASGGYLSGNKVPAARAWVNVLPFSRPSQGAGPGGASGNDGSAGGLLSLVSGDVLVALWPITAEQVKPDPCGTCAPNFIDSQPSSMILHLRFDESPQGQVTRTVPDAEAACQSLAASRGGGDGGPGSAPGSSEAAQRRGTEASATPGGATSPVRPPRPSSRATTPTDERASFVRPPRPHTMVDGQDRLANGSFSGRSASSEARPSRIRSASTSAVPARPPPPVGGGGNDGTRSSVQAASSFRGSQVASRHSSSMLRESGRVADAAGKGGRASTDDSSGVSSSSTNLPNGGSSFRVRAGSVGGPDRKLSLRLAALVRQDNLQQLSPAECALVWENRFFLANFPAALPKFLAAVDPLDPAAVKASHQVSRRCLSCVFLPACLTFPDRLLPRPRPCWLWRV